MRDQGTYTGRSSAVFLAVVIAVYSVFVLSFNHYERVSGDATIYISIAEKYLRGDFANAINGYWGPLLSWLLIPFLFAGASPVFAINSLNLIFGVMTIFGVRSLCCRFEMGRTMEKVVLLLLIPILYFISLIQPMDFLLLCVLVYYLHVVFQDSYPERISSAVASGVLGALAYFAKPFGFPFFISHFLMMNLCHYLRVPRGKDKGRVIRNAAAGMLVFFLLSSVWIGLISSKYGYLTFSNMGRGVLASYSSESAHDTLEKGSPIFFQGFFEPPNDTATVVYEDPSYAKSKVWNPLASKERFRHYLGNVAGNIFECLRILESFSRLAPVILIASVMLLLSGRRMIARTDLLYPLLTIMLYIAGYLPFHFESRYLWIVNILVLLLGGRVMKELLGADMAKGRLVRTFLITLFILSFTLTPVKTSVQISRSGLNDAMHGMAMKLAERHQLNGNIASNRQQVQVPVFDSWHRTFRLSYWLKGRYYGIPRENISDEELEKELRDYNIDYYFLWGENAPVPEFLTRHREMTGGSVKGLRIYSMKEPVWERGPFPVLP